MAQLIFSEIKDKYSDYKKYKPWLRDNSYPDFCGYSWVIEQTSLTIDHYKPREHFPELEAKSKNLILCTHGCNSSKNDYHPDAKNRRTYKEYNYKIFNYREEDIGEYVQVEEDGTLIYSTVSCKERFYFNQKVFKFNQPHYKEVRKEYLMFLKALERLYKKYKESMREKMLVDLNEMIEYCSRRYIFYKLLNIKIPKQIEKLLTNKIKATCSFRTI
ncbi:MAG: hypothetical protein OXM55_00770 [Bdellovibrionales bacterium]|nr:hypothetical protein [Bdellovibrionales bacterium]